jgi:hypothetical protein
MSGEERREEKRREDEWRGEEKREEKRIEDKSWEVFRDTTFMGVRKYISGFEGSQAVPARPPRRGNAYDRN